LLKEWKYLKEKCGIWLDQHKTPKIKKAFGTKPILLPLCKVGATVLSLLECRWLSMEIQGVVCPYELIIIVIIIIIIIIIIINNNNNNEILCSSVLTKQLQEPIIIIITVI
jgi:hypothetical protein